MIITPWRLRVCALGLALFTCAASLAPMAEASSNCQQILIDFSTEDDLITPLVNGQDITTPPEFGNYFTLSSTGNNQGLAIFDTTIGGPNAGGPDPDLLVDLGNSLIMQSNDSPTQTVPGIFDTPNDSARGGTITFDYLVPVELLAIDLIDICPINYATVTLVDNSGLTRVYSVPIGWTEDISEDGPPGYRTLDLTTLDPQPGFVATATATEDPGFDPLDIDRLEIFFDGSASMDNLVFCEICPEESISLAPATSEGPIGTEHTVTATVTDDGGNPVAGRTVNFEILAGSANFPGGGSDVTDASGQATFSYIGNNLGTDSIGASFENPCSGDVVKSNNVTRDWVCPPELLTLAVDNGNGEIGETVTVTATATRTDTGDPLVGVTVQFATLPGSANTASGSDVTDGSGQATFSYVGQNPGTDNIQASFVGCDNGTIESNVVERTWECPVENLSLTPPTSSGPVGTEHTVMALLTDGDSNPIAGRTVNFTTLPGSANAASGSAATNGSGIATFSYIGEELGTDFILATVSDCAGDEVMSNTAEQDWVCPPEAIVLTPPTSEGPIGTEFTVTATVTRTDTGDPLEGRTVEFMTLPGSANDAMGSSVTDGAGEATFTYIGENTGLDFIRASFENCDGAVVQSDAVERDWTCPVESVTLAPLSSEGPVGTDHTVTATVTDDQGDPIEGREVNFSTLPGSANDASGSDTTDAAGQATFTYTGENEGVDTIVAVIEDCLGAEVVSEVVEQEWTCPTEMITITADPPMPTVGMEIKVVAMVQTADNQPVEGRDVTFEFLPGSVSEGTFVVATNANGKAKLIYSQADVGIDFIRASAEDCAGNEISVDIEVIWAECFLWIGKKMDYDPLSPPDDDVKLVKRIKVNVAVLENDIPVFKIPNRPSFVGKHVFAQVYLNNSTVFPDDPIQMSNGLDITLGVDVLPVPYGPNSGIDLWSDDIPLLGQDWTVRFDVRGM